MQDIECLALQCMWGNPHIIAKISNYWDAYINSSIHPIYRLDNHLNWFESYRYLEKKSAGSNDPQKPISSWIPSRDQNKWIFLSMLLNVTAMLVVRDKTNPIQKSFASWNCTESLSPKREAIMEMRWWGGAWHAFKALFNMVMTTIWSLAKILHFKR